MNKTGDLYINALQGYLTNVGWIKPHRPNYTKKIPRNKPCICGSGKKYKKCCLKGIHNETK